MIEARPTRLAHHQPAQSPSRRHYCQRWCALITPFQPSPVIIMSIGGFVFCCRLASSATYVTDAHTYCFMWWPSSFTFKMIKKGAESREVPLPIGSDDFNQSL